MTVVDLAEDRVGFVPSHVVHDLDRFGCCGGPTCGGRAMASGAAHLIDRVLPDVTVRQWSIQTWVLNVPWPRRYLFAARPEMRRLQRARTRPFRLPSLCAEDQGCNLQAAVVTREGTDGRPRMRLWRAPDASRRRSTPLYSRASNGQRCVQLRPDSGKTRGARARQRYNQLFRDMARRYAGIREALMLLILSDRREWSGVIYCFTAVILQAASNKQPASGSTFSAEKMSLRWGTLLPKER